MPPAAAYGTLDSDGGCLAVDHREDHPELSSVFWELDLTDNHSEYGTNNSLILAWFSNQALRCFTGVSGLVPQQCDTMDTRPLLGQGHGSGASGYGYQNLVSSTHSSPELTSGGQNEQDTARKKKCKPCAFIVAMPFQLIILCLYPVVSSLEQQPTLNLLCSRSQIMLLWALLQLLKICCGCGCLDSFLVWMVEIPCHVKKCFESIICC